MSKSIRIRDLIQALTPSEKTEFQYFMGSSYHNSATNMVEDQRLWDFIMAQPEESDFDRNEAYKYLFPGHAYVDNKLEKVLSRLHNLLKKFIVIEEQSHKTFENELALLSFYRKRGLHNRYEALVIQLKALVKDSKDDHQKSMGDRFLLDYELCQYEHQYNPTKAFQSIPTVFASLEANYLSVKIELLNQYLLRQKSVIFDLPSEVKDIINNSYFSEPILAQNPQLQLSHQLYELLVPQFPPASGFSKFQTLLDIHANSIGPDAFKMFSTYLRNIVVILTGHSPQIYLPVLFQLHKDHYQRGYFHREDKLTPSALLSLTNVALRLGESDWCKQVLEEHADKVIGETTDQHYWKLCKANFFFYQKDYESTLSFIFPTYPSMDYQLFARRLEIKSYFELDSDLVDYKIDALKMFISRASKNLISENIRSINANFINLLIQINSKRGTYDPKYKEKLLVRIESKTQVTDREWLIEKVNAIT